MSHTIASKPSKKMYPRIAKILSEHRAEKHAADMERYQANAAFLAKVAEGEYASLKAQAEEAKYSKRYPFQACTFAYISSQFQPHQTFSWA